LAQEITSDYSEVIAENFGANATYVETLLARWQSNPSLVDESWRAYFEELVGSNGDAAASTEQAVVRSTKPGDGAAAAPAKSKPAAPATWSAFQSAAPR
jgi:2-oxoglutarate dehydrogenase complex dehydrogenase (E1) component-like enzyme